MRKLLLSYCTLKVTFKGEESNLILLLVGVKSIFYQLQMAGDRKYFIVLWNKEDLRSYDNIE